MCFEKYNSRTSTYLASQPTCRSQKPWSSRNCGPKNGHALGPGPTRADSFFHAPARRSWYSRHAFRTGLPTSSPASSAVEHAAQLEGEGLSVQRPVAGQRRGQQPVGSARLEALHAARKCMGTAGTAMAMPNPDDSARVRVLQEGTLSGLCTPSCTRVTWKEPPVPAHTRPACMAAVHTKEDWL